MRTKGRKLRFWGVLLFLMLFAAGFTAHATVQEAQAATTGFKKSGSKIYYYQNGKLYKKGWLRLNGNVYYMDKKTGAAKTGWVRNKEGARYFDKKTGAMYRGWVKNKEGYRYFYKGTGLMATGWTTNKEGKRYFDTKTGVMKRGWVKNKEGYRYFSKGSGVMLTGWTKNKEGTRYFDTKTGLMKRGWVKNKEGYRYFKASNGVMVTGNAKNKEGYRYFNPKNGVMVTGLLRVKTNTYRFYDKKNGVMWTGLKKYGGYYYYCDPKTGYRFQGGLKTISGKSYYFNKNGRAQTGWFTYGARKYYFSNTGVMYKNTLIKIGGNYYGFNASGVMYANTTAKINGTNYSFDRYGVASKVTDNTSGSPETSAPSGSKTIKNYLANALLPVGKALYVWGGGWTDSTRKGISQNWVNWYNSQSSSYNYKNYMDLSSTTRAKGLDCSGFVGWAAYQVMQSKSGVGGGYTVVSGEVGSWYQSLGWGTVLSQSYLAKTNYKFYPGDIGYNSGHTWIVLGQCRDKSLVIVHSTPNAGCQISGTPTPNGNYNSQAIALAEKYMSRYPGYKKYDYHTSSGNYIRNGNYLRWNTKTLSDPNGYRNKTADQILKDLFGF